MLADEIVISGNRAMVRTYAKINLTLDVLNRLNNGYHNVKMIMQQVSLFDFVIVDKRSFGISISTNLKYLPNNDKNIAFRAAVAFFEHTQTVGGCKIIIKKNIPVAAGLAGGSSNAAAVLCALNLLYNTGLSESELCRIGLTLGADVPYCITGGTALAEGIGERLTPLPHMPKCTVLMVKPKINVSTAEIYQEIDNIRIEEHPNTEAVINALKIGNINNIATELSNVMGNVTEKLHPVVRGIRNKMMKNGALGAVMSGSGPTVFGIFPDYSTAKRSHDSFAYQFSEVFLVNTV